MVPAATTTYPQVKRSGAGSAVSRFTSRQHRRRPSAANTRQVSHARGQNATRSLGSPGRAGQPLSARRACHPGEQGLASARQPSQSGITERPSVHSAVLNRAPRASTVGNGSPDHALEDLAAWARSWPRISSCGGNRATASGEGVERRVYGKVTADHGPDRPRRSALHNGGSGAPHPEVRHPGHRSASDAVWARRAVQ